MADVERAKFEWIEWFRRFNLSRFNPSTLPMTELEQLTQLCERLGSPRAQAERMAAQLLKRAEQIAHERGGTREAALKRLLDLVVQGHAGKVPPEFAPPEPPAETK